MGQAARAPERIGKYEVRRILGRGAMGVVYLAYDPDLRREVALKTMTGLFADTDREGTGRFYREARSAGSLHHPRIVTIYELGEADGIPFIAMEALRGRDLATIVKQDGPVTPRRALEIVAQIAEGLDFAHREGVVHRDVKPANIFIDDQGQVTLVDFGIAKMADTELTRTGILVGSVDYMSPEQIRGTPPLDGRADLWSAVVILYELLFHAKPFSTRDKDATAVMFRVVQSLPLGAARMARLLPRALSRVILRGLEKNPDHRFPDGAALAAALRRLLQEEADLDETIGAVRGTVVGTGDLDDDEEATATQIAALIDGSPRASHPWRRVAVVATVVLAAALALAAVLRPPGHGPREATRGAPERVVPADPFVAEPVPGFVALNVTPWALLTALQDRSTGAPVALPGDGPIPTPLRIALPPGRYRARLENPAHPDPLEVELVVRPGAVTHVADLAFPGFDADRAVEDLIDLVVQGDDTP